MGARSGVEITHIATLPALRRTRRNSLTPRAGSGKNCKPSWQTTASKLASRNGSAWPSAATGTNGDPYNLARALVSIAGEMSAPTTTPSVPTRGSAIRAASPVPVETSRTRHFGPTAAAASTAGIKSLDHRPVHRSNADASTALPGAAWKPAPNVVLIAVAIHHARRSLHLAEPNPTGPYHITPIGRRCVADFDAAHDRCA